MNDSGQPSKDAIAESVGADILFFPEPHPELVTISK